MYKQIGNLSREFKTTKQKNQMEILRRKVKNPRPKNFKVHYMYFITDLR